jgi:photosystem II stability/assembly factor-like uncharacterized protein
VDPNDEPGLSGHARRAIALIAAAMTAMLVASLMYLHGDTSRSVSHTVAAAPVRALSGQYAAAYDFISPALGWALVARRQGPAAPLMVFATADGAKYWQKVASLPFTPGQIAIQFFDRKHGLISISSTALILYRTSDGGTQWDPIGLPTQPFAFGFADPMHGWVVSSIDPLSPRYQLFATSDGGDSWKQLTWPAGAVAGGRAGFNRLQFRAGGEGWAGGAGAPATVYSTFDGGATWHAMAGPKIFAVGDMTDVRLIPGTGVIALGYDSAGEELAFTSFDHGSTWRAVAPPPPGTLYSDYLYQDSVHWWSMRDVFLFKSSDAGKTWNERPISSQPQDWRYFPRVLDANHAWAQLMGGREYETSLAVTSDGGANWISVNVPQP